MPTRPPRSYGSFCPVAQASEVVAQRWVPLILREIMVGCHRFNEIRRALPLISPSVLAQRLKALEGDGVILRRNDPGGATYHLTGAGEELRPIVDSMGHWARKWITRDYRSYELDPAVLMWTLRRHVLPARFPSGRSVLHFRLDGAPPKRRYWWLVVERREEVDVCMTDPGHPVTLTVTGKPRTLVDLLMEDAELGNVLRRGLLVLEGERELARRFETLFDFEGGRGRSPGACGPTRRRRWRRDAALPRGRSSAASLHSRRVVESLARAGPRSRLHSSFHPGMMSRRRPQSHSRRVEPGGPGSRVGRSPPRRSALPPAELLVRPGALTVHARQKLTHADQQHLEIGRVGRCWHMKNVALLGTALLITVVGSGPHSLKAA